MWAERNHLCDVGPWWAKGFWLLGELVGTRKAEFLFHGCGDGLSYQKGGSMRPLKRVGLIASNRGFDASGRADFKNYALGFTRDFVR